MKDELFVQLIEEIKRLIVVGDNAFHVPLSDSGKKKKEQILSMKKKSWKKYLLEIKAGCKALSEAIDESTLFYRNQQVNQRLAYFRELPRRLSDGADPEWSSSYQEISDALRAALKTIRLIDRKYKLGSHSRDPD